MSLVNKILKIYNKVPLGLLNCIAPLYQMLPGSVRYGKRFQETYRFLERYDCGDQENFRRTEQELFLNVVKRANENVPYY